MKRALVVTTTSEPTEGMRQLAKGSDIEGIDFVVVGDEKTPYFKLSGSSARYYSLFEQRSLDFKTAVMGRKNTYSRKNTGYLLAMSAGADVIQETDDDNIPMDEFWLKPEQYAGSFLLKKEGWVNVYKNFTDDRIWPRGLPLDEIDSYVPGSLLSLDSPIQQGLANDDPDVDAIYRLTVFGLENGGRTTFLDRTSVALFPGTWCPFNSQNTTWFRDAFPLMYLPSTCTFRMTDIWRSFVAQRCLWPHGQTVMFHSPTVAQERNAHNLMDDFLQEIPGYLNNKRIAEGLMSLGLAGRMADSMRVCYEWFVKNDLLDREELVLLEYWLTDIKGLGL